MIQTKQSLTGYLSAKQSLTGKINNAVVKEYPKLENIKITPSAEKQIVKPKGYGFETVVVERVETEELNIIPSFEKQSFNGIFGNVNVEEIKAEDFVATPSTEDQIQEGIFKRVTIAGEENYKEENIKAGTSMWGLIGTYEGESPYNTTMANPNNRTSFGLAYWMSEMNEVDMKGVTTASSAFQNCANLKKVKIKNMGSVKTAYQMFQGCTSLTEPPELDLSSATSIYSMFQNTGFIVMSDFESLKAIDIHSIFSACKKLTKIGNLNFPVATETQTLFSNCTALTEVGDIYIPKGQKCQQMFSYCTKLETIGKIDMSSATDVGNMFMNCVSTIKNIGGFTNLGKGFTATSNNYFNYKLILSGINSITHDSLMNIINGLYDLNLTYDVANGGTLYTQTLNVGSTNKGKLSADEIRNSHF